MPFQLTRTLAGAKFDTPYTTQATTVFVSIETHAFNHRTKLLEYTIRVFVSKAAMASADPVPTLPIAGLPIAYQKTDLTPDLLALGVTAMLYADLRLQLAANPLGPFTIVEF